MHILNLKTKQISKNIAIDEDNSTDNFCLGDNRSRIMLQGRGTKCGVRYHQGLDTHRQPR